MAKIGLENFRYGILSEAADGTPSYDGAKKPGKAVSCSVSITNNSAKLYADNVLAESDTSFQSGTVNMGIDDTDPEMKAELLGHEITDGEIISNSNDVAPYVGLGRIITKIVGGVKKYEVKFLRKVKFAEPSEEDATKGESVDFGTVSIEGDVSTLKNGDWKAEDTFDTYDEAVSYLESLLKGAKLTGIFITGASATLAPTFDADTDEYTLTLATSGTTCTVKAVAAKGTPIAFYKGDTKKAHGSGTVEQEIDGSADVGDWKIVVGWGKTNSEYWISVAIQA